IRQWPDGYQLYAALGVGIFSGLCLIFGMAYVFSVLVEKVSGAAAIRKDETGQKVRVKTQREFLLHCLLPIMLAALTLPLAWAWYPDPPSGSKLLFIIIGIAVALRAIAMAVAWAMRRRDVNGQPSATASPLGPSVKARIDFAWILFAALLTGVLGGVLVWWLA